MTADTRDPCPHAAEYLEVLGVLMTAVPGGRIEPTSVTFRCRRCTAHLRAPVPRGRLELVVDHEPVGVPATAVVGPRTQ